MTKICSRCKQTKPIELFNRCSRQSSGRRPECVQCRSTWNKKAYSEDPGRRERSREKSIKKIYGITLHDYNEMALKQNFTCQICKKGSTEVDKKYNRVRKLVIDHDHKTGKIRGLLCGPCNRALGGFSEQMETILAAIVYLNKYGSI